MSNPKHAAFCMPTPRWDPKGGLFFHRPSPSGQKQAADSIAPYVPFPNLSTFAAAQAEAERFDYKLRYDSKFAGV